MYQRLAGVKRGFPDLMVLRSDKPPIFLELKSQTGITPKPQRQVRLELLAHGAQWYMARSAMGALVALHRGGVEFRSLGGRPWTPPELPPWEQPIEDPSKPHPAHPAVRAKRREAKRRQRAAARERLPSQQTSMQSVSTGDNERPHAA
jgi:hypothetical protein